MMKKPQMAVLAALGCVALTAAALADTASESGTTQSGAVTTTEPSTTESDQAGTAGTKPIMSQSEMKKLQPKDVCERLIQAAKKDDLAAISPWRYDLASSATGGGMTTGSVAGSAGDTTASGDMGGTASGGSMSGAGMQDFGRQDLSLLRNMTCGTERISKDHAFVEVKGKEQSRLIPFVKDTSGVWKFDSRTYMSFYRDAGAVTASG